MDEITAKVEGVEFEKTEDLTDAKIEGEWYEKYSNKWKNKKIILMNFLSHCYELHVILKQVID